MSEQSPCGCENLPPAPDRCTMCDGHGAIGVHGAQARPCMCGGSGLKLDQDAEMKRLKDEMLPTCSVCGLILTSSLEEWDDDLLCDGPGSVGCHPPTKGTVDPGPFLCGACSSGRHEDCSHWCFCDCEHNR